MERLEYKYLMPLSYLDDLRRKILPYVELDFYARSQPLGEYTVRSLYYDTAALDYFYDKVEGIGERLKVRIRAYNEFTTDAVSFLEIKKKTGGVIIKHRAHVPYGQVKSLLVDGDVVHHVSCDNLDEAQRNVARHFLYHLYNSSLRPCVTNIYEREAYLCRWDQEVRLTIDKNIRFQMHGSIETLFEKNDAFYVIPNHFVFEVKTPSVFPRWVKNILGEFGVLHEAVSKYVACVLFVKEQENRFSTIIPIYHQ